MRYFKCPPNSGIFVKESSIDLISKSGGGVAKAKKEKGDIIPYSVTLTLQCNPNPTV